MANSTLLQYLEIADETAAEVRNSNNEAFLLLEECADHLNKLLRSPLKEADEVVWQLAANSCFVFFSAVRTAISGHPTAIFPLLRTALESACYALVASSDKKAALLWEQRNISKNKKNLHRNSFSPAVSNAIKLVEVDCETMGKYIDALYESAIDYGAHPNPRSIVRHVKKSEENKRDIDMGCLYGLGSEINAGLVACLDFGAGIIYLLRASMKLEPFPGGDDSFLATFITKKMECTDLLNGSPVEYGEDMWEPLDPK